uniref:Uncharacterized protein n=1 Tax=Sphaerodactylus townsendi TaxID=933632 RepID=A0ACB8F0M8_9SAUR
MCAPPPRRPPAGSIPSPICLWGASPQPEASPRPPCYGDELMGTSCPAEVSEERLCPGLPGEWQPPSSLPSEDRRQAEGMARKGWAFYAQKPAVNQLGQLIRSPSWPFPPPEGERPVPAA